jgi:predicted regulator of Ras-like GTPase activity (Roadblock/LC7/MglB family)
MPTIRDLVAVVRHREGVVAVAVLGRDGLLIDGQSLSAIDIERVAAHVPSVIQFADELGAAGDRGGLELAVLQHEKGVVVLSCFSADAVMLVVLGPTANIADLVYDLRRHRASMAALI